MKLIREEIENVEFIVDYDQFIDSMSKLSYVSTGHGKQPTEKEQYSISVI